MPIALQGHTWGISDPVFLTLYAIAAIALAGRAMALHRRTVRGRPAKAPLDPIKAAYLGGGPPRAIAAALMALRVDGVVESPGRGLLRATTAKHTMRTPLTDTVARGLQGGAGGRIIRTRDLRAHQGVQRVLGRMRARLESEGLLVTGVERNRLRIEAVPFGVLLVIGIAGLATGVHDESATGLLVVAVVAVALLLSASLVVPLRITRTGRAALADARSGHSHLDPSMSPAWNTYGAAGAALGVGLFGMAAVMSVDPAFAETAAIKQLRRAAAATGRTGSGIVLAGTARGADGSCGGGGGD